jgi:hypothetical protein
MTMQAATARDASRAAGSPVRRSIAQGSLIIGLVGITMILGAGLFQAVVDVPNFSSRLPDTVHDFRACVRYSHPGYFFQVLVPIIVVSLLVSVTTGWNTPRARNRWVIGALAGIVGVEIFTFVYFMPRNDILFFGDLGRFSADVITAAALEWKNAQWLRLVVLAAATASAIKALITSVAGTHRT